MRANKTHICTHSNMHTSVIAHILIILNESVRAFFSLTLSLIGLFRNSLCVLLNNVK